MPEKSLLLTLAPARPVVAEAFVALNDQLRTANAWAPAAVEQARSPASMVMADCACWALARAVSPSAAIIVMVVLGFVALTKLYVFPTT